MAPPLATHPLLGEPLLLRDALFVLSSQGPALQLADLLDQHRTLVHVVLEDVPVHVLDLEQVQLARGPKQPSPRRCHGR